MEDKVKSFLERNQGAVMATLKNDGTPHVARIGVGLVDGKLWSSGTQSRVRTRHLRSDPRSTLMVLAKNPYEWLGLETEVTIRDGDDAPQLNLELYRVIAGRDPDDLDEYLHAMAEEQRLIYEFDIRRAYGQY